MARKRTLSELSTSSDTKVNSNMRRTNETLSATLTQRSSVAKENRAVTHASHESENSQALTWTYSQSSTIECTTPPPDRDYWSDDSTSFSPGSTGTEVYEPNIIIWPNSSVEQRKILDELGIKPYDYAYVGGRPPFLSDAYGPVNDGQLDRNSEEYAEELELRQTIMSQWLKGNYRVMPDGLRVIG